MSKGKGHRTNWVDPETTLSRYPSPLSRSQVRKARKLIASGNTTHAQMAEQLGCTLAELGAALGPPRGKNSGHGNAVLNVKPAMRDTFREKFQREGEAMHATVERFWDEYQHYRAWAEAMGCPPPGSLISLPLGVPVPAISSH